MSSLTYDDEFGDHATLARALRPHASTEKISAFRDVMAYLAAPVTVITASDDGNLSGTTASAVMSISMEPEIIGVSLARTSSTLGTVLASRRIGVNILAAGQADVAMTFARPSHNRFAHADYTLEAGLPRLAGVSGWVRARVDDVHSAGDHLFLFGTVERAYHDPTLAPLTYHSRTFGTHRPED